MRLTTRVGLFCACIGLLAPRVFGDAVAHEGKTFSAPSELFLIEVEHTQDGVDTGGSTTHSSGAPRQLNVSVGGSGGTGPANLPRNVTTWAETLAATPEPASLLLLGTGLAAGVIGRRVLRSRRV